MSRLEVLDHAEIYSNPHPSTTSEYVAFPSIFALPSGILLCMCRHGTARESDDGVVKIHRSADGGLNWSPGGALPGAEATGIQPAAKLSHGSGAHRVRASPVRQTRVTAGRNGRPSLRARTTAPVPATTSSAAMTVRWSPRASGARSNMRENIRIGRR